MNKSVNSFVNGAFIVVSSCYYCDYREYHSHERRKNILIYKRKHKIWI